MPEFPATPDDVARVTAHGASVYLHCAAATGPLIAHTGQDVGAVLDRLWGARAAGLTGDEVRVTVGRFLLGYPPAAFRCNGERITGSRVLVDGHGALDNAPCATAAIDTYPATGVLPSTKDY